MPFKHLPSVLAAVEPLAVAFDQAGHRLYLVGGIVRDQWLDHGLDDSSDIDLTTDALPQTTKELVADHARALWTQGERFGTIGLRFRGRAIEITTHRAESYDPQSRKPAVVFGDNINVDLSRRDFTVNAMAVDSLRHEIVDPWGGVNDLEAKRLRTPLAPTVSFTDDPLRMLRAARFAARFGLSPVPDLVAAATELRSRLRIVAIERIGDEIERLFALDAAPAGIEFLAETGLIGELLSWSLPSDDPELSVLVDRETLNDAVAAVGRLPSSAGSDWRTRLAAFVMVTHPQSQDRRDLMRRLRLSGADQRRVLDIATGAERVRILDHEHAGSLRRWFVETPNRAESLGVAAAGSTDSGNHAAVVRAALDELDQLEDLGNLQVLDGAAVCSALGIDSGPLVGQAIAMLRSAVLDDGPIPLENQRHLLEQWWSERA